MAFNHRSLTERDIDRCLALTREAFAYTPAQLGAVGALWKELLSTGSCISVAVEDGRLAPQRRVVGFGMSVFATDAFAARALAGLPFLSRAFLEAWRGGERPYLNRQELAKANAGAGLNLLILHYGWDEAGLSAEDLEKVRLLQTDCFIHSHAGYKTKEYLQEVFGAGLRDFVLAAGCSLRQDYRAPQWKAALRSVAEADWPFLTGFRPEEALSKAGTAASIFSAKDTEPLFGFSPREMELLSKALEGKTDAELAGILGLSPWTIKKRWQAVYLKVEEGDPALLPGARAAAAKGEDRRPQRRRYLLEYLRQHPEEIRPRVARGRAR